MGPGLALDSRAAPCTSGSGRAAERARLRLRAAPRLATAGPQGRKLERLAPSRAVVKPGVSEASASADGEESFTKRFLSTQEEVEGDIMKQFRISESYWSGMKKGRAKAKTVVQQIASTAPREIAPGGLTDYDVCVCGGNLGIAIALALQNRGHRVLIIERRLLRGRTQEWNASRKEMLNLVKTGLLTEEEVEEAIISEFNPNRVTFDGGKDVWVNDILNIGVAPDKLIRRLKERFIQVSEQHSWRNERAIDERNE